MDKLQEVMQQVKRSAEAAASSLASQQLSGRVGAALRHGGVHGQAASLEGRRRPRWRRSPARSKQNADNAKQASQLAMALAGRGEKGGQVVAPRRSDR